jgi:hypothetical protein
MPRANPALSGRALIACAIVTLLAGCGHTLVVGADRTLQLGVTEYRVNPQRVTASPGALTIIVHNYGRETHNMVVSLDGQTEAQTPPIPPGQSAEMSLDVVKGSYTMASTIMSDQSLGTYGTLNVT